MFCLRGLCWRIFFQFFTFFINETNVFLENRLGWSHLAKLKEINLLLSPYGNVWISFELAPLPSKALHNAWKIPRPTHIHTLCIWVYQHINRHTHSHAHTIYINTKYTYFCQINAKWKYGNAKRKTQFKCIYFVSEMLKCTPYILSCVYNI